MKTLKRLGLMLFVAVAMAPLAFHSIGCQAEVDDDGVSLEEAD
jgi:hypothetical protein